MVYQRKTNKKRYTKKRAPTSWYNKKYSVGDMAAVAYKGVKTLQGIINSEKHFTNTVLSHNTSTSAYFSHLSAIGQDDSITGRTGSSILMKSLTGTIWLKQNSLAEASIARVIIFLDLQQVADTNPTLSTLLEGNYQSQLAIASLGRYQILQDSMITLDNVSKKQSLIKVNQRFDHHIRYNGSSASDIQKGGLYMLLLSNESAYSVSTDVNLRIGFYDN